MSSIYRQSSHGNNISVILLERSGLLRKFTWDEKKYKYLENELKGLKWYNQKINNKLNTNKINLFHSFMSLDISLYKGKSIFYRSKLTNTEFYIHKIIDHYIDIMNDRSNPIIHGDLTLSNIIFFKNVPRIIDWEHFHKGDSFLWGFDLIYLVLSSIILPEKRGCYPSQKNILIFQGIWERLEKLGIEKELIRKPLSYFRYYFHKDDFWKDIIKDSPNKLFPLNLTSDQVTFYEEKILKI